MMVSDASAVKTCSKCDALKRLEEFNADARHSTGKRAICKACEAIAREGKSAERWAKIKATPSLLQREMERRNSVRQKALAVRRAARWKRANPEKVRKIRRKIDERRRGMLTDSYIRGQLAQATGLSCSNIPHSMVEAKREHWRLKRKLKELSK